MDEMIEKLVERKCVYCGDTFLVTKRHGYRMFCSDKCRGLGIATRGVDLDFDWKQEEGGKYACRYNPEGCSCSDRRCYKCGWNPEVANARLKAYQRPKGVTV